MGEFLMPSLGADMTEGTLLQWRVKPGDVVHRGDIVAVVDTAKAEIEVEVFEDGVIEELVVGEGAVVPVGTVLARIAAGDGHAPPPAVAVAPAAAVPPAAAAPPVAVAPPAAAPTAAPPTAPPVAAPAAERVHASPVARRAAEQLGVDLAGLSGTGPHGAITKADVERSAQSAMAAPVPEAMPAPPAPRPEAARPDSHAASMRQAIAAAMERSHREIPQYHLATDIDMTEALAWLARSNAERPIARRILPAALLVAATARAAREAPEMNGYWVDGALAPSDAVHVGMAVSLRGGGLITPAIHDADRKSVDEIMADLREIVARTRAGRLRGTELTDATLTVTSLGDQGVALVHGIIYPPQVALVGFGAVRERPWAAGGMLGVHPVATATLAADHRASDGMRGARFLNRIDRLLQTPEDL